MHSRPHCCCSAQWSCRSPPRGDSADASCEVRKDGDQQKGKSGHCTFEQRQCYIDIDLKNGGEGEVMFKKNCVVYYDKHGRRTSSLPACSSKQVNRAADAMASYRRERGMN